MERHCENAKAVATFLKGHPDVEWVRFPGLEGDPMAALIRKYLRGKGGAMVVFGIKGGAEAGRTSSSASSFRTWPTSATPRAWRSTPASTTHSQLDGSSAGRRRIPPELVRLSVGIEHIDDIVADLTQVLPHPVCGRAPT